MDQIAINLILEAIDTFDEAVFGCADMACWPDGTVEELCDLGILKAVKPASEAECDGCDETCVEKVEFSDGNKPSDTRAYIICRKRNDMGPNEADMENLKRWGVDKARLIELGYYQETKDNRGKPVKKTTKKQAGKKKHFEHWPSPGDACFIIENERITFHYNGKIEDLRLKKDSNADRLIKYLQAPVSGKIVKQVLCSRGTRPSDLKDQTNDQLNKKIVAVGFVMPMNNIEFIRYVDTRNEYECVLEIHRSRDDFMRSELEQPLVDDQKFKELDTAEDQY